MLEVALLDVFILRLEALLGDMKTAKVGLVEHQGIPVDPAGDELADRIADIVPLQDWRERSGLK